MSRKFDEKVYGMVNERQEYCRKKRAIVGSALPYWDPESNNFICNLVTKSKFFEKPTLDNFRLSLITMRRHALLKNNTKMTMPKTGCGLNKL